MPNDQAEDLWVHLKTIQIDDSFRTSKFRVAFQHASGFVQKLEAPRKSESITWECNTYVDMKTASVLTVHRTGLRPKLRSVAETKLYFNADEFGDNKTVKRTENKLAVKLIFGASMTGLEVACLRAEDAKNALQSKKEVVEKLDLFVQRLDFVLQVGTGFAQLHPAAQVAASVVTVIFKNVQDIPNAHQEFTDVIRDMDSILPTVKITMERFTEAHVQGFLKEFIDLVSKTSQEVIKCYSSPKREFIWKSSKQDEITKLKSKIERLKGNMVLAELASLFRLQQLPDADEKSLNSLRPPVGSSYDQHHCCHPGTRVSVIRKMNTWAVSKDESSRLYWLNGVAGCGKSSVAASVADALDDLKLLSGSFICKRDVSERKDPVRIVRTLAYFMARSCKPFSELLLSSLKDDPTILDKPLSTQFKALLESPLKKLSRGVSAPVIVLIDALDECDSNEFISTFLARMVELAPWLRLIVTSRLTQEIRKGLSKAATFMIECNLFEENAHDDILSYIRFECSPEGSLSILHSEVSDTKADHLANKAQGLFIWVATVLKYAGDPSIVGKVGIIDDILSSESASSPEAELDVLYMRVLISVTGPSPTRKDLVRRILSLIFVTSRNKQLPAAAFHAFLPRESRLRVLRSEVEDVFHKSGAVLTKDAQTGVIRVLHPSFLDFIGNENRSKDFWTDTTCLEAVMATTCLEIMNEGLKFNICHLESSHHSNSDVKDPDLKERIAKNIPPELQYSSLYWLDYLSKSKLDSTSQEPLRQMLNDFFCTPRSLYWLESMSLMGELGAASWILHRLSVHLKAFLNDGEVREAASDLHRFVSLFHVPMAFSTPHIYLSALLWAPSDLFISKKQRRKFVRSEALIDGRVRYCPPNLQTLRLNSSVLCVAVSRNGSRIVSGCSDGTIRIWDTQTGAPVGDPLQGHSDTVWSVAYSPDGSRIVSGSDEKTIRIWDAQTGAPVGDPLQGHNGGINAVAYSPDGSRIVSGSDDKSIRIWDAHSGSPVGNPLRGHSDWVRYVAYSPDGSRIVSGSGDETIRIWDAQTGAPVGDPLQGHSAYVLSVAYSPDGSRIISGSADKTIRIWDAQTGAPIGNPFQGHSNWVRSVTYSPDGSRIVSGSDEKTIRIWDAQTGAPVGDPLQGHNGVINAVAYSPDGSRIVSGSDDETIRIWDAQTGTPVGDPLQGHSERVWSVAYSPDGSRIVSGSGDETIRIWDAQTGAPVGDPLQGHSAYVLSVAYSPDGSRIISGSADKSIRIWDAQTGAPVGVPLQGHSERVRSVTYSPDGSRIVSGSADKTIRIWDAQASALVGELPQGQSRWDPVGQCFISTPKTNATTVEPDVRSIVYSDIPFSIEPDGWIRTLDGGLLLWVPDEYRHGICDMSLICMPYNTVGHRVRIDWRNLCHGKNWTKVWEEEGV